MDDLSHISSRKIILQLWSHLATKRKIQITGLFFLIIVSGGSELITLAAAVPFLQAIRDNAPTFSQGASPNVLAPAVLQATIQVLAALGDGGDENTILSKVGKIK